MDPKLIVTTLFFGALFFQGSSFTMAADSNKKISDAALKKSLSGMQYHVTQQGGTEAPFNNAYWNHHEAGIYVDVITKEALFSSLDKYNSGTGWPSFTKPISKNSITTRDDHELRDKRTEVRNAQGTSHLGHVFNDGPPDQGGQRYCMNSASLLFIPADELEMRGYGQFVSLFPKIKQKKK